MLHAFYGLECPHCERMEKMVLELEKKESLTVKRHEVWHHEEGMKLLQKLDTGLCGGVPFFYNTDNDKYLCGEVSYEELREWAMSTQTKKSKKVSDSVDSE